MRKTIFTLVVLFGGYWGATHQAELLAYWKNFQSQHLGADSKNETTTADSGVQDAPPEPEPKPVADTAPAPPPEATPAPPLQAPLGEGIYYTRERITQITDAGVSIINARVRVQKVGEDQGRVIIDDGKQRLVTSLSRLTNDPAEVAAMLNPEPGPTKGATTSRPPPTPRADPAIMAEKREKMAANRAKDRQYQVQIEEINRSIAGLAHQIAALQHASMIAKSNGRPSTYNDRNIASLNQRIAALEAQRAKLRVEQAGLVQ